jgi:DNA-binding SARP family transcriptional activator
MQAVQNPPSAVDGETSARTLGPTWDAPVQLCLLGSFRLVTHGQPVVTRPGGKLEELLSCVALADDHGLSRERLLTSLWPTGDSRLAAQSLNTLVYNLHRLLGEALNGQMPVVGVAGMYRLNRAAGIDVDVACFDRHSRLVGQRALEANLTRASALDDFATALTISQGDLCVGSDDVGAVVERERLRARYHTVLSELADYHAGEHQYTRCLEYVHRLLRSDPCREDAHRLAIRCYVRLGQRGQALHQYRVCEHVLKAEYDAPPEPATVALFDQVRLDPTSI